MKTRILAALLSAAALAPASPALAQGRPGIGQPSGPQIGQASLQPSAPAIACNGRVRVVVRGEIRSPNLVFRVSVTNAGTGTVMTRVSAGPSAGAQGTNSTVWRTLQSGETRDDALFVLDGFSGNLPTTDHVVRNIQTDCR